MCVVVANSFGRDLMRTRPIFEYSGNRHFPVYRTLDVEISRITRTTQMVLTGSCLFEYNRPSNHVCAVQMRKLSHIHLIVVVWRVRVCDNNTIRILRCYNNVCEMLVWQSCDCGCNVFIITNRQALAIDEPTTQCVL